MSNTITIACAPCCWGVDDVRNPDQPPWERVLNEAAEAGFGDELERIVRDVPADVAGLYLDTEHLDYAGMDPVATLRVYADRTDYIQFKDIDPAKYEDVMGRRIRFFEACAKAVMCPIGRGRIDYAGVRDLLTETGYAGYITIEQERDPRNAGGTLADLAASRGFLRETGFQ